MTISTFDDWTRLAEAGNFADAVEAYIRGYDYVTFVELQKRFAVYFPTEGSWGMEPIPNVSLWEGMSKELVDILDDLRDQKRLFIHPANPLVYMIDGGMLRLPLATRPTAKGYKKPHWYPVCLRTVPLAAAKRRKPSKQQ